MLSFILDNSVSIIAGLVFLILGTLFIREKVRQSKMTVKTFGSVLRTRFNTVAEVMVIRLISAALITLLVSMVSFRELWLNDVFHVVFITMLLIRPVSRAVDYVIGIKPASTESLYK